MEEEILDIKRENYKLRKENFELIQDNTKLQEEINILNYKLKEAICSKTNARFKELQKNSIPKSKIKEQIEEIINTTLPPPLFKPKMLWNGRDYERLYKTEALYKLLEE